MVRNAIFDWSGTLSDDQRTVYAACMGLFDELEVKRISYEEFRREMTLPYMNFYRKYTGAPKEELDSIFIKKIHALPDPLPFDGALEMLTKLRSAGVKMAVLSSVPQSKIDREVIEYGFDGFFEGVYASAHDKRHLVERITAEQSFVAAETCMVGDMVHDIDTAKHAGLKSVAVTWGYDSKEKLAPANPDVILGEIGSLADTITRL